MSFPGSSVTSSSRVRSFIATRAPSADTPRLCRAPDRQRRRAPFPNLVGPVSARPHHLSRSPPTPKLSYADSGWPKLCVLNVTPAPRSRPSQSQTQRRGPSPHPVPSLSARRRHSPHPSGGLRSRPRWPSRPPLPQESAAAGLASCSASCTGSLLLLLLLLLLLPTRGSVGAQLPGSAGRAGAAAAPPRGHRAPAPTDLDPVGSRREVLATPTPRGPKFPESGDLAWALLPGPAGGALGPPTLSPAARPGRPRSVLVSADRGILLRGSVSHLYLKLVGTTVCVAHRWGKDEGRKSTRFWSVSKVICGLRESKVRGRSQSH
ncbi:hypothetical protein NN561_018784 [Cricetulus griseus]